MTELEDKTGLMKRFMQIQANAITAAAEQIKTVNYRQYENPELGRGLAERIPARQKSLKE